MNEKRLLTFVLLVSLTLASGPSIVQGSTALPPDDVNFAGEPVLPGFYEPTTVEEFDQGMVEGPAPQEQTLPPDVSSDWWSAAQKDIRQSEYHITPLKGTSWQEHTYPSDLPAAYQAPNRAHNLRTYFSPAGIRVIPRTESTPAWEWGLSLSAYGYAGDVRPVAPAELAVAANRIEYRRGELVEWYVNDERGLEQGFTLATAPQYPIPNTQYPIPNTQIVLELTLGGDLTPNLTDDGTAIEFSTPGGVRVLRYSNLLAYDTTGRAIPTHLSLSLSHLSIWIDATDASYPVTLDLLAITLTDWGAQGDQAGMAFGQSVGTAGDVNGDGYDDIIVGAPTYDGGQASEGRVFVWYGGFDGLGDNGTPSNADWWAETDDASSWLGTSVGTAGDVNNDGYDDVIVGARQYHNDTTAGGRVFVWHGSDSGLVSPNGTLANADWWAEDAGGGSKLGQSVGTAGDVNGDDYDDVIVGAPEYENGQFLEGAVFVWYGAAGGLGDNSNLAGADWRVESDKVESGYMESPEFGWSVNTAGDVNNDGYDDIIVGAPRYESGMAFVWHGSSGGLAGTGGITKTGTIATANWSAESTLSGVTFGFSVSTAGRVNADGYDDVIVGAYLNYNGQSEEGAAFVYHGSATGLSTTADWTAEGGHEGDHLGFSVGTAGDTDGDGYDDVIAGAPGYASNTGRVSFWLGSPTGLLTQPVWHFIPTLTLARYGESVGTAGDVNGDGYAEFIIGAPQADVSYLNTGHAYVIYSDADQPDIRIEPNSLSFDLSSLRTTAESQPAGRSAAASTPQVILSDDTSLILDFETPMADSNEVQVNGETYQRLALPNEGLTDEIGRPQLPVLGRWIAIPAGSDVTVQVLDATFTVVHGYQVYPAQEPLADQGPNEPGFSVDTDFYQRDAFYPQPLVVLEAPVSLRGIQAVPLRVYPFQYNPQTGALRVYSHVRLKLNFISDSTLVRANLNHRSPYFDEVYKDLFLNYGEIPAAPSREMSQPAEGADFMIITAPQFATAANTLATWRRQQGITTQVLTTDQTGTTAAAIQTYIQNAYDTWSPAPSFVLLLGDAEFIPPHYETVHPYEGSLTGTDLYYATVDGTDYFPDISLGRIAVDSAAQAEKSIDDIIGYERDPVSDADFYSSVAMAAYFQDYNGDGYSDRRFVLTSEEIRDYLLTQGYAAQRIYTTGSSVNPTHYNNGTYANGQSLPAELLRANGFAWDGDRTDISNAVNAGAFILNHRDHGDNWGWGDPRFTVGDVDNLTNGDKLPVVFSINCRTGWFDNETDDARHGTGVNDVCFAEAWQRNPNGGALGVIASTRVSYSGHNDALAKGFYDAIWPKFLSYSRSPGTSFSDPQRRMGNVLNYGKLYYASQYGDSVKRKIEFEMFHYFGDPTSQIWTALPSQIQKTFTIYNDGAFDLTVTDISKQNDSCWLSTVVGSGLPLVIPPGGSETVVVTVDTDCVSAGTHSDRLLVYSNDPNESPYPDAVNVALTVPEVNEVVCEQSDVDSDSGGNEDGVVNPGETVTMDITLRNLGNDTALDVGVVMTTASPYADILDANVFYSAVGQDPVSGDGNDTVQFEVSSDTPGGTVIFFNLQISASNGGPWQTEFAVIAAPDTTAPHVPSSPSPADDAHEQPLNISLAWVGGDPDNDQVTYDVYVSTEHPQSDLSTQNLACTNVTTPICDVVLISGTRYFWYVIATDEHNATTSGPVWDFVTIDETIVGLTASNDSPTVLGNATTLTATIAAGGNVSYTWAFDDGDSGSGTVVTHTYSSIGVYTASVTASNTINILTATTTVTVTDVPIAGLAATNDSPTTLGSITTLTATITAGSNVTYTWTLGNRPDNGSTLISATGAVVNYTYPAAGVYTAAVTASNNVNLLTATTTVTIVSDFYIYLPLILLNNP